MKRYQKPILKFIVKRLELYYSNWKPLGENNFNPFCTKLSIEFISKGNCLQAPNKNFVSFDKLAD